MRISLELMIQRGYTVLVMVGLVSLKNDMESIRSQKMVLKEIQQMVHPEMTMKVLLIQLIYKITLKKRMKQIAINHWTTPR